MKKIKFSNALIIKYTLYCIFLSLFSCKAKKTMTPNQRYIERYIEGLFYTEKMPADIGEPFSIYLKFKKDGTVISMSSPLECDTVNKLIDKNYAEIGKYSITKKDSIIFKFTNNRINSNEYTSTNRGLIINKQNLEFNTRIQYKGNIPYTMHYSYSICK